MPSNKPKLLIFGVTGMLGHTLLERLSALPGSEVYGTVRRYDRVPAGFPVQLLEKVREGVDAHDFTLVEKVLDDLRPTVVINCVGVIKQLDGAKDPLQCIAINALFPHLLAKECGRIGARLLHVSTDCVFSGQKGGYVESDVPDCNDLYGRTKLLGEIDYPHAVTLRTSIIGHELNSNVSLVDWFLAQDSPVRGFSRAIYTGFPTVEMARIIVDYVLPRADLRGLYHVSSEPISKYELLCLVRDKYGKSTGIEPDDGFVCDRSLDSRRFRAATGYLPPSWPKLIAAMHADFLQRKEG